VGGVTAHRKDAQTTVVTDLWPRDPLGRFTLRPMQSPLDYFQARVKQNTRSGCWNWTGYVGQEGYGEFHLGGERLKRADVLMTADYYDPIQLCELTR